LRQAGKVAGSIAFFAIPRHFVDGLTDTAMHVLITGATGFVGSHAVEALSSRNVRIRALVRGTSNTAQLKRYGAELVVGGFDDPNSLQIAVDGVDIVVHLAALTRARTDAEYHRVNEHGTRALIQAMTATGRAPRRLVYLSSLAAVGPATKGRPVQRDDTPRPLTADGRSKLAGEAACWQGGGGIVPVVLRATAVYGPRERDLYSYFRMASLGLVASPAGPERWLQLIHVQDLADALVHAIEAPGASGVYHVADPSAYRWNDIAGMIASAVGGRAVRVRVPVALINAAAAFSETVTGLIGRSTIFNRDKARELLAPAWLCETESARQELGFETRIPLAEGLLKTAQWYRANGWL
jgi:nucleoside-diphosphate-sugar epimerase